MNVIAEILGFTEERYAIEVFKHFSLWCELNSDNIIDHQALVSNQKLYNWFTMKYRRLEVIFYDQVGSRHQDLSVRQKHEIHASITRQIQNYYPPRNLIIRIKKNGLENAINNN